MDAAKDGDTIIVYSGIYEENVDVNKELKIISQSGNPEDTIVKAVNPYDSVLHVTANNVNISGFTVTNASYYSGISLSRVEGCVINNNNASGNMYGINLFSSNSNTLSNNTLSNNKASYDYYDYDDYYGAGLDLHLSSDNMLTGNIVSGNEFGIYLGYSSGNMLTRNIASDNERSGIYLRDSNDNTLADNAAPNNKYGISLGGSNNTLTNNTASDNDYYGISLSGSDNTLTDNIMTYNKYNFGGRGINDIDTSNTVDGKPIYYLVNLSDITLDSTSNAGTVYCINCRDISIKDLNLENNEYGIYLHNTTGSNIDNNEVSNNDYSGIFHSGSNNTLTDNTISGNDRYGIFLSGSNNTLTDNTVSGNEYGIRLLDSSDNTLIDNTMIDNTYNFGGGEINDIDTSNTVDGKLIYYFVNLSDITLDSTSNAGTIYCFNCLNISIKNLNLENNGYGIYFYNTTGSNIDNNEVSNNSNGIYLSWDSSANILTNNIASNNECGIELHESSDNTLTNNIASNNSNGIFLRDSSDNTLTDNTALNNDYCGIYLWGSRYNTLTSNIASNNNGKGIELRDSSDNTLTDNTASNNNEKGLFLWFSNDNTLTDNTASNNYNGIYLWYSNGNILTSNIASNNSNGIELRDSSDNTLTDNTASNNNEKGLYLWWYSSSNMLTGNLVSQNEEFGIYLTRSMDNLIYDNYFNGTNNAYDEGNNIWNTTKTPGTNIVGGPFLGGNYWSDYAGNDTDGDGLGDTLLPYNSGGRIENGGDYLPLVTPSGTTPSIPATVESEETDTSRVNYEISASRSGSRLVTRPGSTPDSTVLSFDPETAFVIEGESTEIRVMADEFPEGLAGYNLTFSIEDPAIAEITEIEFPAWANLTASSGLPAASVYMAAFDGDEKILAGAESVILGNLAVSGKASGKTNLTITVKDLDDDSGNSVEATVLEGSIEVKMALTPEYGNSPENPDTVGVYEGFTGNEEISSKGLETFYNIEWIKGNMLKEFFDFNGDGKIDFKDLVVLFKTG